MRHTIAKLLGKIDSLEKIRKLYIFILIFFVVSIVAIMNYSSFFTSQKLKTVYSQYFKESVITIKKDFLKDSVNKMINNVDQLKKEIAELNRSRINRADKIIGQYYEVYPEDFLEKVIDYIDMGNTKESFSVIILDTLKDEILYQNNIDETLDIINIAKHIEDLRESSVIYSEKNYGKYYVFYGVTKEYIKSTTLEMVKERIYSDSLENDSYIWIDEIMNYDGGDNYGIRLVHPSMQETEGMYLSTSMQDTKGNYLYSTELAGIRESGEVFFSYFFKKRTTDSIEEKLSYARLYKEYNWIIATGIYFDEIQPYIDEIAKDSDKTMYEMNRVIIVISLVLMIIGSLIMLTLEEWYYTNSNKELKEELNIDDLTKAFNRRAATKKMEEAFYSFKRYGHTYAIMMLDIDNFKNINDSYGHDVGDVVLARLVATINNVTRKTDFLYRWGGEEFLLICEELKMEYAQSFVDKILKDIENCKYESNGKKFNITVSIGVSYFNKDDEDYLGVFRRADKALYDSKSEGKNRVTFNIGERETKEMNG